MTLTCSRRFVLSCQAVLTDPTCWVQHVSLNQTTGLDPTAIKLRASECASHKRLLPSISIHHCTAAPRRFLRQAHVIGA